MTSSLPRSSPPPGLPRDLVARARIQTESEELSGVADARVQALLAFELGALHEHGLRDAERGAEHYRQALEHRPAFRPALFALARLYTDAERPLDAASVWDRLARASRVPAESAGALCEAGLLLYDRLGEPDRAAAQWEEALIVDPSCLCAALLLEHHHRAASILPKARHAVEAHVNGLSDPALEAALLVELAAADERAGETDVALARLAHAGELDPDACAVWYETARIARRHEDDERLVAALQALAERERAGGARGAALLCEAARLQAVKRGDPGGARALYDRALELLPGDALALWERALLHCKLGQRASAIADARTLLTTAGDGALAAAVRVRLGELLQAEGEFEAAIVELQAASAAATDSAAATAGLEDALLRAGRYEALRDHLLMRAERGGEGARAQHLLRAGRIALLQLDQPAQALELLTQAVDASGGSPAALRSLYAAAVFADDSRAAVAAAERLCHAGAPAAERSLLRFDQYHRTLRASDAPDAVLPLLSALLREPQTSDWAPQAARIHAAGARHHALLAAAHDALAASAEGNARAAAHLCAAGRALARAGDPRAAADRARAALRRAPEDTYALALLESCLLAAGDSREAALVLRDAARAHAGGQQRELTLLAAGAAAETAGDPQAAARSYEEAAQLDAGTLAPRWALLRLAERTRDRGLLLGALERLAQRERELPGSGIANLELGELLGIQRMGQPASTPLSAALGRADTRAAAALELCTLPAGEMAPALRDEAIAALSEACPETGRLAVLRDGLAERLRTDTYGAHALLEALVGEHDSDPALAVTAFAAARNDGERADAVMRLAQASSDANAGAELSLYGMRIGLLARGEEAADDALLRALEAAQRAPGSLAAAVALDEALWAGDDAESRSLALSGRLAQAEPETRPALLAARARTLLAAGRAAEAAHLAGEALASDPADLALWELQRAAARARADWESAAEAAEQLAQAAQGRFRTELLEEAAVLLQNELGQNERAERCLRAAFDNDPTTELAFAWLHDLLLERRDLPGVLELVERRTAAIDDRGAQLDLSYERALLLRAAGRGKQAIDALDALLASEPGHTGALGLLAEACTAAERWPQAIHALQRLAECDVPDAQKRMARRGAAEFLERRLGDASAACAELEALCALAPDDAADRARLADAHERCGRYREAVQGYLHAASLRSGSAAAELERRAGTLLRERLAALGEAAEAYERALAADPLDDEACAQLLGISDSAPERERIMEKFSQATHRALEREPLRPELLRKLRRLGTWQRRSDVEWIALGALRALDAISDSEQRELDGLAHALPPATELARNVLARIAGALGNAPLARGAQLVSAALGAASPETEVEAGALERAPAAGLAPPEQRYQDGARALARHLGIESLRQRDPVAQRDALRAAFALSGVANAPVQVAALGKQLGKQLSRAQRKELARALAALADPERAISTYLQALDEASLRAGLLAADDPRPALARVLPGARVELEACATSPLALDLLRFWLSRDLLNLRRELGRSR